METGRGSAALMAENNNNMNSSQGQEMTSNEEARLQEQRLTDSRFQQMESHSPHLAFQDSNLSPALMLLPSNSGLEHNTDYSLFQQTDLEFAPLRAFPDMSLASEKFQVPLQEFTCQTIDQASLSQHPLEEAGSSYCSLSQHSLSLTVKTSDNSALSLSAPVTDKIASKITAFCNLEKVEDTSFLNKDVPVQQLIQSLQRDVGVLSGSSSTNSSKTSEMKELKYTDNFNPDPSLIREGPPGEASVSQQQQQPPQTNRSLYLDITDPKTSLSNLNITVGSRSSKPDDSSEALRQELLDIQGRLSHEASEEPKSHRTPKAFATPFPTKIPKLKTSLTQNNLSNAPLHGPFSTGIQQRFREQDLWSSGNQTGIDGSYLGFIPQSQSTPGVFKAPTKSSAGSKFQQLSDIESTKESLTQTSAEVSRSPASASNPEENSPSEDEPTCEKVQALPSLTYMQKVDAWRTNQNSGKSSLFDSLALQGFTGVSPKKKAYDAVSDSLNRILSQQVVKMNQNVAHNPFVDVSNISSPRREEAVGSAPSDKDNIATQSASPFNRSQSHSSLSTVVMSVKKDHLTEARIDKHDSEEAEVQQLPTNEGALSPLVISLGQFSDITLSNSQDSSNSGQKVATSVGTSSVSLEVDNYDPYWTGKLSTPPPLYKPRELNIEERIPVYLQNLGINQSPSTILTPFAPRGPIREPEFSPTDLCTIKGSTPTKSIQPSEGGTPHKVEFSRSSLQSMDSSFSVPLSAEAHFTRASSSSDASAAVQFDPKLHPHPIEDIPSQQQSPVNLGPSSDQEDDKNLESKEPSTEQNGEMSFVSSGALSDIRKLLSQAENLVSPQSSAASDKFLSLRKEASFTSAFSTEESKSQSSHPWTRSSSDSALTLRERLTGGENVPPTKQSGVVSRSAGLSLVLNKSVQRAEPEGCSAAPPDRVPPPQPQVPPPLSSASTGTTVPEENTETSQDSPVQSSTSSPVPAESVSDGSSESSLAIRVAKLLQTESPATMVSSTTSVDQEEGRAREWLKQMISGQKCEPLELDQEDRRRIEEIKRELLLKNPKLGYISTDTESSAASSLRHLRGLIQVDQEEANKPKMLNSKQPSDESKSFSTNIPQQEDIEAKVREIAAREGLNLPKTKAPTSITISTCRRSISPSPSTSPTPGALHFNQLTADTQISTPSSKDDPTGNDENALESHVPSEQSQLVVRQDTVGGQNEDFTTSALPLQQNNSSLEPLNKAESAKSGHVSQVRLTLSPKPVEHVVDGSSVFIRDAGFPQRHFVPLRHSPSALSPDEGVGMSSPPEWQEVPKRRETNRSLTQQRAASSVNVFPKPLDLSTTRVPHLLPYKPRGSEELFYVPQAEADSSNDTTMESTHTGSDDALPPRFGIDVLGQQDPGPDRGVTIRHSEGIYSKRQTRVAMTEPEHRDAVNKPTTPKPTSPVFTQMPPAADADVPTVSRRDQGTSPVPFFSHEASRPASNRDLHTDRPDHSETSREKPSSTSQQDISDLDQLWQRFSERWREDESRNISEREVSLLERLECLSRILQSTRDITNSEADTSNPELHLRQRPGNASDLREKKKQKHMDKLEKFVQNRKPEMEWNSSQDLNNFKSGTAQEQTFSDTRSSMSMSTVDTARLIRAFGADRVQKNLRSSSSSLSKLYSAISKQKEHEEQARTPSETSVSEESSVATDSVSSTCTYTLPPHRGPSKSLVSKRTVKLVSKGIQAGDLEIVSNGTRRHTRDVGTTFPSPSDRAPRHVSSLSSSLDRERKTQSPTSKSQKHRKSHNNNNPPKHYPHAVSWFVSADELKADGRKENEPEPWRPSSVWFEPMSQKPAWREPLRERPVEEQRNAPQTEADPPPGDKKPFTAQATLQDALRAGRPDFMSRSRQRLQRLALQVEERRLQTLFQQEREELFIQPGGPGRLPRPAGTAHLRRAVPRKEMIQRSKQIYENLPEVRRRKEEEQRRVEYRSYRLNAQLYNKRITNHVLGRRSAWS